MLDRMHGSKVSCDELKTFYNSAFTPFIIPTAKTKFL